jgi:hypothetical protein
MSAAVESSPIAQRILSAHDRGSHRVVVPVTIYQPRAAGDDWRCAYEIAWPGLPRRGAVFGVDSVQALLLAMQTIGALLYTARPPGMEDLQWLEKDGGFGFPLAPAVRDLAIGDDRLI